MLTNRKRFPKYFQLLPSSSELANAYNGILEEFGWRHVAFIVQDEDLFTIVRIYSTLYLWLHCMSLHIYILLMSSLYIASVIS